MLKAVRIMGVLVHSGPAEQVVAHIDQRLSARDATRVAFLNAHLSNLCSRNLELQEDLRNFLVLNDGVGLDIASWALTGSRFPHNLNGTDFVSGFLDSTRHDLRIFLLGARPDVIAATAERMKARWPRHTIVGHHHGFITAQDEPALEATLRAARADLVLVGMGNPRQERWIARHVPDLCPCGMAVGAWFDFTAGVFPRAPDWVRAARAEWLFRLLLEPRRLAKRYLIGNIVFLTRVGRARFGASTPQAR